MSAPFNHAFVLDLNSPLSTSSSPSSFRAYLCSLTLFPSSCSWLLITVLFNTCILIYSMLGHARCPYILLPPPLSIFHAYGESCSRYGYGGTIDAINAVCTK